MKKTLIALAALAMIFVGCSKNEEVIENVVEEQTPQELTFDFNITRSGFEGETRALKKGWENGDIVFIVFNPEAKKMGDLQYMQCTYDGKKWVKTGHNTNMAGEITNYTFTSKDLGNSGKLTAFYLGKVAPAGVIVTDYSGSCLRFLYAAEWEPSNTSTFKFFYHLTQEYLTDELVPYTVKEGNLQANIALKLMQDDNILYDSILDDYRSLFQIQVSIPNLNTDEEWGLSCVTGFDTICLVDDYYENRSKSGLNNEVTFMNTGYIYKRSNAWCYRYVNYPDFNNPESWEYSFSKGLVRDNDMVFYFWTYNVENSDIVFQLRNKTTGVSYEKTVKGKTLTKPTAVVISAPTNFDAPVSGDAGNGWKVIG